MITFFKEKLDAGYLQRIGGILYVLRECKICQFLCEIDVQLLSSGVECIITCFPRIFFGIWQDQYLSS